jgi:hypothetical protein
MSNSALLGIELLQPGLQADQTICLRLVLAPGGGSHTQSE